MINFFGESIIVTMAKELRKSKMIEHIKQSIENAEKGISKLPDEILKMEGMSGVKNRHFYNNILGIGSGNYLEIGCWKGSSTCSALYKNDFTATVVDSFGEWGDVRKEFTLNTIEFDVVKKLKLIDQDYREVDVKQIPEINIYLFDGPHDFDHHFNALDLYKDCLADEFIYIVDDYSWPVVKSETERALEQFEILYSHVIEDTDNQKGWWNGIGVFYLRKK